MGAPLAYLLTWRTYGTWLHGDGRGSVDWQHNAFGTPMLAPSSTRTEHVRSRMRYPPILLTADAQALVASVIADHCRIRQWELCESAVRSNHVHVVVTNAGLKPEPMMNQLKAYATRALRSAGLTPAEAPVWAEGGSTQYLWTATELDHACAYVREGQDVPR
jgi:REP element-mobilizing transposase RayT